MSRALCQPASPGRLACGRRGTKASRHALASIKRAARRAHHGGPRRGRFPVYAASARSASTSFETAPLASPKYIMVFGR